MARHRADGRARVVEFFFSSRRRHTRLQGDWSSDVCSSDLAAWLARGVDSATQGQVLLQQPRGTLWNGSASLVFTGGAGSRDRTALPTRLEWTLRPRLDGARIQLRSECCTPTPVVLDLLPRWQGLSAVVHDSDTRWPASLLSGLGTPWNTVDLQGQLRLATQALQLQLLWQSGRWRSEGSTRLEALAVSSQIGRASCRERV